jgi:ABC-2 type transport system ATP-binding protein
MIKTDKLSFSYKDKPVLGNIDLHIPKGAIYGYLGKNGAENQLLSSFFWDY